MGTDIGGAPVIAKDDDILVDGVSGDAAAKLELLMMGCKVDDILGDGGAGGAEAEATDPKDGCKEMRLFPPDRNPICSCAASSKPTGVWKRDNTGEIEQQHLPPHDA